MESGVVDPWIWPVGHLMAEGARWVEVGELGHVVDIERGSVTEMESKESVVERQWSWCWWWKGCWGCH
jgi:hypothetical protein